LLQFFAFPNIDEGYAGVIRDTMSRPQFPVIDILRDKTSEVNGETVCGKIRKVWIEKRRFGYIECQENMLSSLDA
jgi:hypothetical protein